MLKVAHVHVSDDVRVEYDDGTMSLFAREELAEILQMARSEPIELCLSASQFDQAAEAALRQNTTIDGFIEDAIIEKLMREKKASA